MTTTKELLLQSFTKSREVIQKERKALNACVVELGGETTVERVREMIQKHRKLDASHYKPIPGQGGTLTWVHLVTNTISRMVRSGLIVRTGLVEIRVTAKGRRDIEEKSKKARQMTT